MALIKCRECGAEISSAAKSCPKCGAPQNAGANLSPSQVAAVQRLNGLGGRLVKKTAYVIIGSAVAVVVLLFAVKPDKDGNHVASQNNSAESSASPAKIHIGDTVKAGSLQIEISSVTYPPFISDLAGNDKPADGGMYVAVKWKYKNVGTEPIGLLSTPSIHLIDPHGVKYDTDTSTSAAYATDIGSTSKLLSDVNPGITIQDGDVFEVSKKLFSPRTWSLEVDADSNYLVSLVTPKIVTQGDLQNREPTVSASPQASSPAQEKLSKTNPDSNNDAHQNGSGDSSHVMSESASKSTPPPTGPASASSTAADFNCVTSKHVIIIDQQGSNTGAYRYRAWNKPKSTSEKPDLQLLNGTLSVEGTGACAYSTYDFKKGNLEITVDDDINCVEKAPPKGAIGNLDVLINGKLSAHFYCTKP